jgi:lycopene cyclase domain-containing protein
VPRYFILTVLYFWIPVVLMGLFLRSRTDQNTKKAFWWALLLFTPMTFAMEYVFLWADIWNFSEAHDPLLGLWLWGAPIEEFSFWFGATPFILLLYLTFHHILKPSNKRHA